MLQEIAEVEVGCSSQELGKIIPNHASDTSNCLRPICEKRLKILSEIHMPIVQCLLIQTVSFKVNFEISNCNHITLSSDCPFFWQLFSSYSIFHKMITVSAINTERYFCKLVYRQYLFRYLYHLSFLPPTTPSKTLRVHCCNLLLFNRQQKQSFT